MTPATDKQRSYILDLAHQIHNVKLTEQEVIRRLESTHHFNWSDLDIRLASTIIDVLRQATRNRRGLNGSQQLALNEVVPGVYTWGGSDVLFKGETIRKGVHTTFIIYDKGKRMEVGVVRFHRDALLVQALE